MPEPAPVALVTGGSRGIGLGIVKCLAEAGYDILINHVRPNPEALGQITKDIEGQGHRCHAFMADISNTTEQDRMLEFCDKTYGRLNLLVNNAGVAPLQRQDILETTVESFDRLMHINLRGPFQLTQKASKWMLLQAKENTCDKMSHRIVNISSISTYTSSISRAEYCISKAGVGMMTSLFADRLAAENIGVFEVRPGIILTDMTGPVKAKYDELIKNGLVPQKRWGTPEDVGRCVKAIAMGLLDFCQGQVIDADGGFHIRRL